MATGMFPSEALYQDKTDLQSTETTPLSLPVSYPATASDTASLPVFCKVVTQASPIEIQSIHVRPGTYVIGYKI